MNTTKKASLILLGAFGFLLVGITSFSAHVSAEEIPAKKQIEADFNHKIEDLKQQKNDLATGIEAEVLFDPLEESKDVAEFLDNEVKWRADMLGYNDTYEAPLFELTEEEKDVETLHYDEFDLPRSPNSSGQATVVKYDFEKEKDK